MLPGPRPDPACTPGVTDPRVTQANITSTICVPGYTTKVRPPVDYTNGLRPRLADEYGEPHNTKGEIDHFIPLELGGAPSDIRNLWIQPGSIPNPKDKVEDRLKREVCANEITLAAAQAAIVRDWKTAP